MEIDRGISEGIVFILIDIFRYTHTNILVQGLQGQLGSRMIEEYSIFYYLLS